MASTRPTRALVLGGGGITGMAWEVGVLVALRDAGIDVQRWDLVVGTSGGSIVGARLLGGVDLDEWFAAQAARATPADDVPIREVGGRLRAGMLIAGRRRGLGWLPRAWLAVFGVENLVRLLAGRGRRVARSTPLPGLRHVAGPDPLLSRVGSYALAARTAPQATFIRAVESFLDPVPEWPDGLVVTAIDALTGETVAIGRDAGVPLGRGVAATSAVPILMPPVTLGGRPYYDGGVASQTHAALAAGYDEVVVVVPLDFGRLSGEVATLRESGSEVLVVAPSLDLQRTLGRDIWMLDPSRRSRSAAAGLEDGRRVVARPVGSVEQDPHDRVEGVSAA